MVNITMPPDITVWVEFPPNGNDKLVATETGLKLVKTCPNGDEIIKHTISWTRMKKLIEFMEDGT